MVITGTGLEKGCSQIPRDRFSLVLFAFFNTLIAGVAKRCDLIAVQESARLRHVGNVARSADQAVHETGRCVNADMGLHTKMPFIALLRLMHSSIDERFASSSGKETHSIRERT